MNTQTTSTPPPSKPSFFPDLTTPIKDLSSNTKIQKFNNFLEKVDKITSISLPDLEAIEDSEEAFAKFEEITQQIKDIQESCSDDDIYERNLPQRNISLLHGISACNILAKKCIPELEGKNLFNPKHLSFINKAYYQSFITKSLV